VDSTGKAVNTADKRSPTGNVPYKPSIATGFGIFAVAKPPLKKGAKPIKIPRL
jgi:hypothetical protein